MNPAADSHLAIVVNTLGHIAGVAAFGVFLCLLWRSNRREPRSDFWLPATAGGLALLWNIGSLIVLLGGRSNDLDVRLATALSFAVLSLLPSVLLHLSLGRRGAPLLGIGYSFSLLAVIAHLSVAFGIGPASHQFGLLLITYGFGGLAIGAALVLTRDRAPRPGAGMRIVAAMALFLFAVSFIHFGSGHGPDAWAGEILIHHAGIPLALFVLLQDYRFLLLDVFVRFLGGVLLAVAMTALMIGFASAFGFVRLTTADSATQALLVTAASISYLLFPAIRDTLRNWVEAVVFRRGDLTLISARIRELADQTGDEDRFLRSAARKVAEFVNARRWEIISRTGTELDPRSSSLRGLVPDQLVTDGHRNSMAWAEVSVPLRLGAGEAWILLLGTRQAGRRYLSEDLADLDRLAAEIIGHIERRRRGELQRLVSQAELDTLRAQINPHFFFNSLNALYGVIPRSAAEARKTLLSLVDIFRYLLQGKRQFVPLEEELKIVEAYLRIERLRLGRRLTTEINVSDEARPFTVPVLSIQPLVENAVKHGVSVKPEGGIVRLEARILDGVLHVEVCDDGPGFAVHESRGNGHGLLNVRRRLQLCHGAEAELTVRSSPAGTTASLLLPALKYHSIEIASEPVG